MADDNNSPHPMDEDGNDDAQSDVSDSSSVPPHAAGDAATSAAGVSSAATPAMANPLLIAVIEDPKLRFILELEFVEMLASPHYLHFLAQSRYLVDPNFIRYLTYLQYWHESKYAHSLTHPHALYFLDLLQVSAFRTALLNPSYITLLHEQQFWQWKSGRYNMYLEAMQKKERQREIKEKEEEKQKQEDDDNKGNIEQIESK